MNKRKKFPLILKIVLMVIVVVGLMGTTGVYLLSRDADILLTKSENDKLQTLLSEQTHEVEIYLQTLEGVVARVATNPRVVDYLANEDRKNQDQKLVDEFRTYPLGSSVLNLYLLDTKGDAVLSLDTSLLGNNYSFRNYFKDSMASGSGVMWAMGAATNQPGIYFSSPVIKDGKIVGVAAVKLDAGIIGQSVERSHLADNGSLMLVNKEGVVIYSNKPESLYKSLGKISDQTKKNIADNETFLGAEIKSLQYDNLQELVEKEESSEVLSWWDEEDNMDELLGVAKVGSYILFGGGSRFGCYKRNYRRIG